MPDRIPATDLPASEPTASATATDAALLEIRRRLADTTRCPSCGAPLDAPLCRACGVDLRGQGGVAVLNLSRHLVDLLDQRQVEIVRLRDAIRPRPQRSPGQQPPGQPAPGQPAPAQPAPAQPPPGLPPAAPVPVAAAGRPARVSGNAILLGLGALLLSVAALGFLVFSWRSLPLGGRAGIIAACTAAVLGLAAWLRPRLPQTAEAVGALGVALVLGDAWAVRRTGLLGADQVHPLGYAAGAAAAATVLLGGWALWSRVRAGSVTAAALGPAAAALAGARLADATDSARELVAGLLAAAVIAAGRHLLPRVWLAERVLLRLAAAGALTAAAIPAALSADMPHSAAAVLLGIGSLVAGLQARVDRAARRTGWRRAWSLAVGALAALVALPLGRLLLERPGLADGWWLAAVVPALAGAAAAAVALRRRPAEVAGALAVTGLATLPAFAVLAADVAAAAEAAAPAWRLTAGTRMGDAAVWSSTRWAAAVLGLVALAAWTVVAHLLARRPRRLERPAIAVAGAAAGGAVLLGGLAPALTVLAAVLLLGAVAAAAGTAAALRGGRWQWLWLLAALAAAESVLLAWSVRSLSVPVTLAAAAALLAARSGIALPGVRAALAATATAGVLVAAGALAALDGRPAAVWFLVAGTLAALLVAALLVLPGGLPVADRLAGASVALGGTLAGLVALVEEQDITRGDGLLAAVLAAVLAVAAAARPEVDRALPAIRALMAAAVVPAAGALGIALARDGWPALPAAYPPVLAALAGGLVLSVANLRRPAFPAGVRLGLEAGTAIGGAAALVLVPDGGRLWLVLLGLGAAAAAVGTAPDRHRVGWLAGLLLTASSWSRLADANVGVVEAYTLPPAAALLAVAALRLRRDPTATARVLAPGAGLALGPSILAVARGGDLRPAVLLAAGAGLALAGCAPRWWGARWATAARFAAGAGAAGTAVARLVAVADPDGPAAGSVPEPWTLAAAVILAGIGAARLYSWPAARSWPALGPALAVGLLPSLVLAQQQGGPGWRSAGLFVLAGAITAVGAATRLQAPLAAGAAVLAVHATVQLAPSIAAFYAAVSHWLVVGLVGLALLWLGSSYERRVRRFRARWLAFSALR